MSVQGTVAVLTYHSIAVKTTQTFASLTVDPALFDEHLAVHACLAQLVPGREDCLVVAESAFAVGDNRMLVE